MATASDTDLPRSSLPIASRAASSLAGVPPRRGQEVRRDGAKACDAKPASDVADMVVEAAVLVDDQHGRLERAGARLGDIGLVAADQILRARGQARVVGRDDGGGRG